MKILAIETSCDETPEVRLPRSVPLSGSTPEERDFGAGGCSL